MSDTGTNASAGAPARQRVIEALMGWLAEKPFEQVSLGDVARRAGVSLAELRGEFSSVPSILAAYMKEVDRKVLASDLSDMADESSRERLFDILMRRIEALTPHKAALRSLLRSALCNLGLAMMLNGGAVRSLHFMLEAADIDTAGPRGLMRAQGLALLYARVLRVWADDEDPGLARTMSALDRELARGARWSGMLDGFCRIPRAFARGAGRRAPRRRGPDDEAAVA